MTTTMLMHTLTCVRPWHHVKMVLPEEPQTNAREQDLTIDQTMTAQHLTQLPGKYLWAPSSQLLGNTSPFMMLLTFADLVSCVTTGTPVQSTIRHPKWWGSALTQVGSHKTIANAFHACICCHNVSMVCPPVTINGHHIRHLAHGLHAQTNIGEWTTN